MIVRLISPSFPKTPVVSNPLPEGPLRLRGTFEIEEVYQDNLRAFMFEHYRRVEQIAESALGIETTVENVEPNPP